MKGTFHDAFNVSYLRLLVLSHYAVFTPVLFGSTELNSSLFPSWCGSFGQVWFNRTRWRTKQPYQDPAEEVVSVRFQTNSGTVERTNQCMTLAHVWFCLQFLVHLQQG